MLAALAIAAPLAAEEAAADSNAAPAASAAPASAQEIASGVCAGCHNPDGNSVIPMNPILAGQQAEYITKQLQYQAFLQIARAYACRIKMLQMLKRALHFIETNVQFRRQQSHQLIQIL